MPDDPPQAKRRLSPAQKLRASMRLYWSARRLKAAALRVQHPAWTQAQVQAKVRALFLFQGR